MSNLKLNNEAKSIKMNREEALVDLKHKIDYFVKVFNLQNRCINSVVLFHRFLDDRLRSQANTKNTVTTNIESLHRNFDQHKWNNWESMFQSKNNEKIDNNLTANQFAGIKVESDDNLDKMISSGFNFLEEQQSADHNKTNNGTHYEENLDEQTIMIANLGKKLADIGARYQRFKASFDRLRKLTRAAQRKHPISQVYDSIFELNSSFEPFSSSSLANKYDNEIKKIDHQDSTKTIETGAESKFSQNSQITDNEQAVVSTFVCPYQDCLKQYKYRKFYTKHLHEHFMKSSPTISNFRNTKQYTTNRSKLSKINDEDFLKSSKKTFISSQQNKLSKKFLKKESIKFSSSSSMSSSSSENENNDDEDFSILKRKRSFSKKTSSFSLINDSEKNGSRSDSNIYKKFKKGKKSRNLISKANPDLYRCEECGYRTHSKEYIDLHQQKHSNGLDEPKFECSVCGKTMSSIYNLKVHTEIHQNNQYECPIEGCMAVYSCQYTLKRHIRRHKNLAPVHRCDWPGCDYVGARPELLRKHRTRHTGERNFPCQWPSCGKWFKTKSGLFDHVTMHRNERRHACTWPGCTYRCNLPGNLRKHMAIHEKKLSKTINDGSEGCVENNGHLSHEQELMAMQFLDVIPMSPPATTMMIIHDEGNID